MTATNSEVLFVSWIANLPEGHSRTGNRVANATIIELLNSGGLSLLFAGTGRGLRRFPWRSKAFVVGGSGGRCCDRSGKLRFGGLVLPSLTFFSENGGAKFRKKLKKFPETIDW